MWSYDVEGRFQPFEGAPDWSVLHAELPSAVLGGFQCLRSRR